MNATTVAIDLAKDVFELAYCSVPGVVSSRKRLRRNQLTRAFDNVAPMTIVMEACGSAHYWARTWQAQGHSPLLLPAQHTKPFVRGNKTDRTDTAGLLTAHWVANIRPVPIKTAEQQGIQGLHRLREHHKQQRTASINVLRGLLREFGLTIPLGAAKVRPAVLAALEAGDNDVPIALRHRLAEILEQVREHAAAMDRIEADLKEFSRRDVRSQRYISACGVGLITATALSASMGALSRYPSGRHFSSSLGLTPNEHSSGNSRRLGKITKRGDVYLRTLLIQGARSLIRSTHVRAEQGKPLDALRQWVYDLSERVGHNKAAGGVANKLARRLWAVDHHGRSFDPGHVSTPPTQH